MLLDPYFLSGSLAKLLHTNCSEQSALDFPHFGPYFLIFITLCFVLTDSIICQFRDTQRFTEFAKYRNTENKANLPLPLHVPKLKAFQLQGGFAPDPLTRGSVPGPR